MLERADVFEMRELKVSDLMQGARLGRFIKLGLEDIVHALGRLVAHQQREIVGLQTCLLQQFTLGRLKRRLTRLNFATWQRPRGVLLANP